MKATKIKIESADKQVYVTKHFFFMCEKHRRGLEARQEDDRIYVTSCETCSEEET